MKVNPSTFSISVIILTFNSANFIDKCIASLLSDEINKNSNVQIIVIDNKSQDETLKKVQKYKTIKIIKNEENYGFSKAINTAIKTTSSDYVLFLNPDVILQKRSIYSLLTDATTNNSEISSGLIYDFNDEKQHSFARIPTISTLLFVYTNLRKIIPFDHFYIQHYYLTNQRTPKFVEIVTGGYMLVHRKVFEKIGYFDENFFMYLEDVDFCIRANNKNIKISICRKSIIKHYGGGSSKNIDRILHPAWINSRRYFAAKHFNIYTNLFIQPLFFLDGIIINTLKTLKSYNT